MTLEEKRERKREYDKRNRAKITAKQMAYRQAHPEQYRAYRRKYAKTVKGQLTQLRATIAWGSRNPQKRAAHTIVNNAVAAGILKKPDRCSVCQRLVRVHGHHSDYMKPLIVVWLCQKCHVKVHKGGDNP